VKSRAGIEDVEKLVAS